MALTRREIDIIFRAKDETKGGIDKLAKKLKRTTKQVKAVQQSFKRIDKFFTGFRAELLGIGFLFGSIGAVLTGLIKQATNVFGTLGNILTRGRLAFLELQAGIKNLMFQFAESDALRNFLDIVTDLLQRFDDLDPSLKELAFTFIIWGGIIATILSALAFMGLGIFGIILLFITWSAVGTDLILTMGGLKVALLGITNKLLFFAQIVALIVAGLALIDGVFKGVNDVLDIFGVKLGDGSKEASGFAKVLEAFAKAIQLVLVSISVGAAEAIIILGTALGGIVLKIGQTFELLGAVSDEGWALFILGAKLAFNSLRVILSDIIISIKQFVNGFIDTVNELITQFNRLAAKIGAKPIIIQFQRLEETGLAFDQFDIQKAQQAAITAAERTQRALTKLFDFGFINDAINKLADQNKRLVDTFNDLVGPGGAPAAITQPVVPLTEAAGGGAVVAGPAAFTGIGEINIDIFNELQGVNLTTEEELNAFSEQLAQLIADKQADALRAQGVI